MIRTSANVTIEKDGPGFTIKSIALTTEVEAGGIDAEKFRAVAQETKKQCPVSKALASVPSLTLEATLKS